MLCYLATDGRETLEIENPDQSPIDYTTIAPPGCPSGVFPVFIAGAWAFYPIPGYTPTVLYRVTRLAFRNRFTGAEKAALYTAAASNVALRIYLDDLAAATYVDLSRADTIASIQALVTATLLTQERADAILEDPVQDHERP